MFRAAESLATRGSFALARNLESWPGFGAPRGLDGNQYWLFGPGQAIVAAPFVRLGQAINKTERYRGREARIPTSHYLGNGLADYFMGQILSRVDMHALRFLVSFLNALVSAAVVAVSFVLLHRLTGSAGAAGRVSLLLAFGSLLLPYSGTFFSEPLALLFTLSLRRPANSARS